MKETKINKVLYYLKSKGSITQLEAYNLCCATRLSAIIFDLKRKGYNIITEMCIENGSRFARYRIGGDE